MSNSTSSTNDDRKENLSLHYLVTGSCALSFNHPNGYGFLWGVVANPNFFTITSEIKFTCEPLSNKVSIFWCLEITQIWKISCIFLSFSSSITDCAELLVDASEFLPFIPMAAMIVSSPESDPKSFWIVAAVFFFLPSDFLGLSSGCRIQQCSSSCPSFLQWVHEALFFCVVLAFLAFHFYFLFFLFLLTVGWDDPPTFGLPSFPLTSICVAYIDTSSILVGLNMRMVCLM